jgi:hypothetical protein
MKIFLEYRELKTYRFAIDPVVEGHLSEEATLKEKVDWINSIKDAGPTEILNVDKIKPVDVEEEHELTKWNIEE